MPDIFISYSTADEQLARFLHQHLTKEGVEVFLAGVSLQPGQQWSQEILNSLKASSWVLFLASRAACASPWVQQELGAALVTKKKLVPIIWDMEPTELPGWIKNFQALNLKGATIENLKTQMTIIANNIKSDKVQGLFVVGVLAFGLLVLGSKS